jgi:hypothetical protein
MTSPADQGRIELRRHRVFELKTLGLTNAAVAQQLGISTAQVHKDFHGHIANIRRDDTDAVNAQWALHMERYDRLISRWIEPALTGEHEESLQATGMLLKIMERQEKISGLIPDKPLLNFNILQNVGTTLEEAQSKMDNYLPIIRNALVEKFTPTPSAEVIEVDSKIVTEEDLDFDELLNED